jgi:hypothetical protein
MDSAARDLLMYPYGPAFVYKVFTIANYSILDNFVLSCGMDCVKYELHRYVLYQERFSCQ